MSSTIILFIYLFSHEEQMISSNFHLFPLIFFFIFFYFTKINDLIEQFSDSIENLFLLFFPSK